MTEMIDTNPKAVVPISILAMLFGTGSWIALTGLWLEMPLLLQQLPEGWTLASHLNMMIQLANIGPLLYWIMKQNRFVNDISATHIQMLIGLISCLMLIGFWQRTICIFGGEHSIFLLIFTFGLALVDCTSSVTFLPFMARFDSSFMTPYLVGEGLSGFIPSLVVLIQGVGHTIGSMDEDSCPTITTTTKSAELLLNSQEISSNISSSSILDPIVSSSSSLQLPSLIEPRFSVEIFFTSLFITLIISYLAFLSLEFIPFARHEQRRIKRLHLFDKTISNNDDNNNINDERQRQQKSINLNDDNYVELSLDDDDDCNDESLNNHHHHHNEMNSNGKTFEINRSIYFYLLGLMFWNSFTTFGFMPPLQPFSAMPYSADTLHYVVILASISYPVGCFYGMLVEHRSIRMITMLTVVATILAVYILISALMSPSPPLVHSEQWHTIAAWIMVAIWAAFITIASYAKTMITLVICDYNRMNGMFWVGMQTQFGSAIGASIAFLLINYTHWFNQCYQIN
ncbi:riboflavin transporter 2 [Dermatophagoides farinae]|nr:riboflavin transporter 2 [Dermatophagoides farinae]